MMRLARRASLLIALSLLTSTATAYAECAWVLWSTANAMSSTSPSNPLSEMTTPSVAFTTKNECDNALRWSEAREEERRKTDPSRERYFACLPDTVDPREPKAGGR